MKNARNTIVCLSLVLAVALPSLAARAGAGSPPSYAGKVFRILAPPPGSGSEPGEWVLTVTVSRDGRTISAVLTGRQGDHDVRLTATGPASPDGGRLTGRGGTVLTDRELTEHGFVPEAFTNRDARINIRWERG